MSDVLIAIVGGIFIYLLLNRGNNSAGKRCDHSLASFFFFFA